MHVHTNTHTKSHSFKITSCLQHTIVLHRLNVLCLLGMKAKPTYLCVADLLLTIPRSKVLTEYHMHFIVTMDLLFLLNYTMLLPRIYAHDGGNRKEGKTLVVTKSFH